MAFRLSEEQRLFRDSLRRVCERQSGPHARSEEPRDWRMERVEALAQLGVFAALLPEAAGGLGAGAVEAMIIGEELGRAVLPTHLIETVALTGLLLSHGDGVERHRPVLTRLVEGRLIGAFVGSATPESPGGIVSHCTNDRHSLTGAAPVVTFAPVADTFVIAARAGGETGALALFVLAADQVPQSTPFWTVDDLPAASLMVQSLEVGPPFAIGAAAEGALERAWDTAMLIQASEINGVMATLLNQTSRHLRLRKQFGVSLSSFQALQHRFAEMVLAYHQSLALTHKAAWLFDAAAASERAPLLWAMAAQAKHAARLIGHEAIQFHGAMGLTEELIVGPAVQHLVAMEPRLGRSQTHVQRHADLLAHRAA